MTISNNVIYPLQNERTSITYELDRSGMVTAQVFTLDGNLVQVLHRGRQAAGQYVFHWDGTNMSGQVVARGLYFIRVVGPDIDEIRKVLVVK